MARIPQEDVFLPGDEPGRSGRERLPLSGAGPGWAEADGAADLGPKEKKDAETSAD